MQCGFAASNVVQAGCTFENACLLKDDSCLHQHEAIRYTSLQRVSDGPADDILPFQAFPCSHASGQKLQVDHFQH